MVGKLIFKIEALSFKVFTKYFKFIKFVVFIFFFTYVFFDFQFCQYRILDFMEVEHIVLKQALSMNIIFHMKHTKFQYSHSFSDTLINCASIMNKICINNYIDIKSWIN